MPYVFERASASSGPTKMSEKIYVTRSGWIYEVWFEGRVIVIGCCATLEEATRAAAEVLSSPDHALPDRTSGIC